ncbi:CCA tRNA nucleotidyltransferase [Suicoccus acidiformans]|uniref:CCA-adding enzyme n=1 Tax=Suicoccus acidiformans TaxID=2036206 RepID=A0A347WL85_9LACT|nr:CCA tRNA nucleotidyltransferase [Suicoccus acidiformans]AXY25842.1 CCA tRNA nucleotidyltransferase [Suicoccus acidiformans]
MLISLEHRLFQEALPVMERIEAAGYEAYFVGGCVRDTLLKRPIHDVDIASSARPDEIEALFHATIDLGKEHGTMIVVYHGETFEVTTFRTEGTYSDFRRPDEVTFVRNLEEDTLRRDFTINALAADSEGVIYDYHGGLSDLEQGYIRAVGNPAERFAEDSLRTMRALRFASQLGFEIEGATYEGVQAYAHQLKQIAIERIRVEMSKYLQGEAFPQAAHLLVVSGVNQYLPGFDRPDIGQALAKLSTWLSPLIEAGIERDEALVWAFLLYELRIGSQARQLLRTWTFSKQFMSAVTEMLTIIEKFDQQEFDLESTYHHTDAYVDLIYQTFACRNLPLPDVATMRQQLPIQKRQDIVVNGKDLMDILGLTKGTKDIGVWLERIERAIIQGDLPNDLEAITHFIRGD